MQLELTTFPKHEPGFEAQEHAAVFLERQTTNVYAQGHCLTLFHCIHQSTTVGWGGERGAFGDPANDAGPLVHVVPPLFLQGNTEILDLELFVGGFSDLLLHKRILRIFHAGVHVRQNTEGFARRETLVHADA